MNSIKPKFWGPGAWNFIHAVCYAAPDVLSYDEIQSYKAFFYSLQNVLPCLSCQQHFKDNLESVPMNFRTRDELFEWSVRLHNSVNSLLGKRQYTVKEARAKFEKKTKVPILVMIVCAIILVTFVFQ